MISKFQQILTFGLPLLSILFLVCGILLVGKLVDNHTPHATLKTNMGDIVIQLDLGSPRNVYNFARLANSGFYNGVKFHRVIKDLLIQTGDPFSKDDRLRAQWGHGGPGFTAPDEFHPNDHMVKGMVVMANNGPDTNGSQFFILTADEVKIYERKYTIIGKVISGMDVVDKINSVPVGLTDIPETDVVLETVKVDLP